jgi:hypothetical protein
MGLGLTIFVFLNNPNTLLRLTGKCNEMRKIKKNLPTHLFQKDFLFFYSCKLCNLNGNLLRDICFAQTT